MILRTVMILLSWGVSGFIGGWLGHYLFETQIAIAIGAVIGILFLSPLITMLRRGLAFSLFR
ncbi:MAG: hypothetical protein IBX55_23870 [Methyloprofundus sp.]|nr:hypothetical protein [Methyloprofundus sp.]